VNSETLKKFGAVSEEVAKEMAKGALKNSHAQIAIAVTGIAGPAGGTENKPVGSVCVAWACLGSSTNTATMYFKGDRASIRMQAVKCALEKLLHL